MTIETIKIISMTVSIICIIFISIQALTYFPKNKANNAETNIYSLMLIINIISLISEILFYRILNMNKENLLLDFVEKSYYVTTVIWMYLLTI